MRIWLTRLMWKIRAPREVRVQYKNNQGAVDGILIGIYKKHYVLTKSYFYEHTPNSQGVELLGTTWIRKEEVLLLQVKDAS